MFLIVNKTTGSCLEMLFDTQGAAILYIDAYLSRDTYEAIQPNVWTFAKVQEMIAADAHNGALNAGFQA